MSRASIRIAATFTAEPLSAPSSYLMEVLGVDAQVEFAPFNQIFQELLNPASILSRNESGANVLLLRLEDLADLLAGEEPLRRNASELVAAIRVGVSKFRAPLLLIFCPPSGALLSNTETYRYVAEIEQHISDELGSTPSLYIIRSGDFQESISDYDNPSGQKLASVPYTDRFYAALAQRVIRKVFSLLRAPSKVIAIDCDNTLWKGVCGEVGPHGIELDPPYLFLQQFLRNQYESGMLLCLASKNNEPDVWEVFSERADMVLKPDHIVSSRINWEPKSANLKSLAHELQLGLDSFIFIDDDPVVCAEVEANCPSVMTICLPSQAEEIEPFFLNHWSFDRLVTTAEDSKRTAMYKENAARNQLLEKSLSMAEFLESLELQSDITSAANEDFARVAQLSQRTNQFNSTTIRRTERELEQLLTTGGGHCLIANVRDRFGDYGLVGSLIYFLRDQYLEVDTFLLSCRALGRGVEFSMLRTLGEIAQREKIADVVVNFAATEKNLPIKNFLEGFGDSFKEERDGKTTFRFPSHLALKASCPTEVVLELPDDKKNLASASSPSSATKPLLSAGLRRIALDLRDPEALCRSLTSNTTSRPALDSSYVEPGSEIEKALVEIWQRVLKVNPVGVLDDFFQLGGDSLVAVSLFVEIAERFGRELPIATLFTAPTIQKLGSVIAEGNNTPEWRYLVPIQQHGNAEPLFCMHAAGGNVLFYRDLSKHLGNDQPVYGVQARESEETGAYPNRVEEMAEHYLKEILSFQPNGPYYLCGSSFGGLVAYEVAQQLRKRNKDIALLALFDTYGPGYPQTLTTSKKSLGITKVVDRFRNLAGQLDHLSGREKTEFIGAKAKKVWLKMKRKWIWKRNEFQLNYNRATGKALPKDLQRNQKAIQQALDSYQPQRYEGTLTLFRAATQPKGIISDPFLGWKELAARIDIYESPGTHGAMTVDPYAKSLADILLNSVITLRSANNLPETQSIFADAVQY